MKKILITLMGVTFINVAFAFDGWFSPDQTRCKVEYTRLDLVTGIETRKKHTHQDIDYGLERNCYLLDTYLANKIESWLMEDKKNIIVDMSLMYCKMRTDDGIFSNVWTKYKQCDAESGWRLLMWTTIYKKQKEQLGYNAHYLRLKELVLE